MSNLFVYYPKCSTCLRAKKWLDDHGIDYTERHIVEQNPTEEELADWVTRSGKPLKRFFNTSGIQYRSLGLKDKLLALSEEDQAKILASNGMLVKRPILDGGNFVLTGFREEEWEKTLL